MILSLITPVLGSLTVTYSDDTIILDFASKLFVSIQSLLSFINFHYAYNVNSYYSHCVRASSVLRLRTNQLKARLKDDQAARDCRCYINRSSIIHKSVEREVKFLSISDERYEEASSTASRSDRKGDIWNTNIHQCDFFRIYFAVE